MSWDAIETPLDEAPLFPIEAADWSEESEVRRVIAFRRTVRLHAPALSVVAVPNAANRGQWAINQAKKEGAAWGFPDLMVLAPGKVAFIEFKAGRTKPAAHQVEWLNKLHRLGFPCGVFRTSVGAMRFLREHDFPVGDQHG